MEPNTAHAFPARLTRWILSGILAATCCIAAQAQTQTQPASDTQSSSTSASNGPVAHGTIAQAAPVTYDNKYELYGGLSYMNFKAGPYLPKRMNMGGGELMGTYWLGKLGHYAAPGRVGLAADYRFEAGTTPIAISGLFGLHRTLVFQNMIMGGAQVRGPRNEFFALDAHVLAGRSWGNFSHGTLPAAPPEAVGLYTDRGAFISAIGMSVDINQTKRVAIRLSPDLMLSRFGTYTATNFALSGGIIYRFGKR